VTEEIVLLAVTRMLSGFCIAGVDERGVWRRPVKRFKTLLLGDVSYRDQLDGKFFPLVVGVHVVPDYDIVVDPKHP